MKCLQRFGSMKRLSVIVFLLPRDICDILQMQLNVCTYRNLDLKKNYTMQLKRLANMSSFENRKWFYATE